MKNRYIFKSHVSERKFRERIFHLENNGQEKINGEIEIDESYFGARRFRGKRGRGAKGKTPVVGLLNRQNS